MHCNGCARKVEKHISKMEGESNGMILLSLFNINFVAILYIYIYIYIYIYNIVVFSSCISVNQPPFLYTIPHEKMNPIG